jgi:hypothetical protein
MINLIGDVGLRLTGMDWMSRKPQLVLLKGRVHLCHNLRYDLRFDLRFGACVRVCSNGETERPILRKRKTQGGHFVSCF